MILSQLQISNLRNINQLRVDLHPHINLISGYNGSGKTSFLEALYLLGCGHSFRTREVLSLISHQQQQLTVFARTADEQSICISKAISSPTIVRINSSPCLTNSDLARFLPSQILYQDIFNIIDAGPGVRRSLLDWGLFHVEPNYHSIWKDYRRALKQRNALLKKQANSQQFLPWDSILSDLGEQLDAIRSVYVIALNELFQQILTKLTSVSCCLTYYKGWDRRHEGKSLNQILKDSFSRDVHRQYTHYGAHQADLLISSDDLKARQYLSRGEQKIVLFALKFAQVEMLKKKCIYLIDDIAAELDDLHLGKLFSYINHSHMQYFITSNTKDRFLDLLKPKSFYSYSLVDGNISV